MTVILSVVFILSSVIPSYSANDSALKKVFFEATEPDAEGMFNLTIKVYNAKFNAFQFALSYDKSQVSPVDNSGNNASNFSSCGTAGPSTASWMVPVGNKLDTVQGLLECGGYVQPGSGVITADNFGIKLYTFTFKQNGSGDSGIKLATIDSGGPYNPTISDGGGLAEAGYKVDASINIVLPESLGSSTIHESNNAVTGLPDEDVEITDPKTIRLRGTVILQIGNYAAVTEGVLFHVDNNNKLVTPYIDENDRTMIPVRFLAESMGADVRWDNEKKQVTIVLKDDVIVMTIGSLTYTINGIAKTMDTVPVINNNWDRTLVPARFAAEALGRDVKWDSVNNMVIVSPVSNPWDLDGVIEIELMKNINLMFSPIMRDFIQGR